MIALNLGCGSRTSERCINIDWSVPIRLKASPVGRRVAPLLIKGERRASYDAIGGDVLVHDLRKGIPMADASVDVVYHSHVFEHIDRDAVDGFLAEIHRVLKPGGVQRIVVPDLERLVRAYLDDLEASVNGSADPMQHDRFVSAFVEQMVRREASGSSQQSPMRRRAENALLGDARKRGETHQWMWDRVNIAATLGAAGFQEFAVVDYQTSRIPDWPEFGLDRNPDGSEYKPGSLYVECVR
ncbi:MAG TPA: methyltransferase domain-containing protein [Aeromicrobium sp.]|nr:methyltransferase domain-containing protein [Aeromicrobium sp.]